MNIGELLASVNVGELPFIDSFINSAGAMAPFAVLGWFLLRKHIAQAEEDRNELRQARREMLEVIRDNTEALHALRDSMVTACRFGDGVSK